MTAAEQSNSPYYIPPGSVVELQVNWIGDLSKLFNIPAEMLAEESANYAAVRADDSLARRQFTEPTR